MSRKRRSARDEPFLCVRTSAANLPGGSAIGEHSHDWHQLISAPEGLMTVWTQAGTWVAPPGRGVWVPAGVRHSIRFVGQSALRTVYLKPEPGAALPARCASVTITPLLRALVGRAVDLGMLDRRDPVELALSTLLLAEVRASPVSPLSLQRPSSGPLRAAERLLLSGAPKIASLARAAGLGRRTLERRFLAETGLTVGRWRQQRVLLTALEQLAAGSPVKVVAAAAGYSGASAFVAAFRKQLGTTPARYFSADR